MGQYEIGCQKIWWADEDILGLKGKKKGEKRENCTMKRFVDVTQYYQEDKNQKE
jgi:hypothetical protein